MARVVFFSFDYDDVFKANQVRNSGAFVGEKRSGFRDKAEFEKLKRTGDNAIENWIREQMHGCSVTCVLIGRATSKSRWVKFEIKEAIRNGMGLLGIYIHHLNAPGSPGGIGLINPPNPLDDHAISGSGFFATMASERYSTYKWGTGGLLSLGSNRLGDWINDAAKKAGR